MTPELLVFALGVLGIFVLDWLAVGFSWIRIERFTKPLAMILVITWTMAAAGWSMQPMVVLLILAQLCGLAGDILLMLPSRWFLMGLGAFLVGHLLYISLLVWNVSLSIQGGGFTELSLGWVLLILIIWAAVILSFYRFVAPKSPRLTMPPLLWIPIQVYGWILSGVLMLSILAVLLAPAFSATMLFLPAGAFLFYISDSLLAYDRFKRKMPKIRVWVMVTYHLAQFSLAWGFLTFLGQV
ncbi:MAG: lysoplasmalogenase [Brevefilum sp.]|nr:lysoplasmalogenase [Brevefilum sp.]